MRASGPGTAGLESLLPQAIIVRLHLTADSRVERVEFLAKLLVRRVVGFRRHEAQELVDIVERVPDHVLSRLELRPAESCCQLGPGERVLQHQDPFARAEADLDLLTPLDLLPHHHSFLTLRLSSRRSRPAQACCWTRQPQTVE